MDEEEKIWGYEYEKDKTIKQGSLLLSEPFMADENFRRTVVLVCENNLVNGTIGIILNKPIKLRLNEVVEDFPPFKGKLYLGGPVGTDTMQFIHSLGDEIEGTVKLADHLYWGGNFEQLKMLIKEGKVGPSDVHFYLGYSGWGVGQLEDELKSNSWIVTKATHQQIFQIGPDDLWKAVMKNMGGLYDTMADYPEDPLLN